MIDLAAVFGETIYAIVDDASHVRYVGRTANTLKVRLTQHRSQAKNGAMPLHTWLRTDPFVKMVVLQICPDGKQDTGQCEADWIRWFRAKGEPILNVRPYIEQNESAPPSLKTIGKLEKALDRLEKEKMA